MPIIRDLQTEEDGWCVKGKFDSTSLFNEEMTVTIFTDDGATVEYAERCIEHYNKLNENLELIEKLHDHVTKFFLYMYDEWSAMGIFDDIVAKLEPVMEDCDAGGDMMKYLSVPKLYVYPPEDDMIGYTIECECPWEPEHQCLIVIREDELLYVGQSDGSDPWGDEDDYECIWEEED